MPYCSREKGRVWALINGFFESHCVVSTLLPSKGWPVSLTVSPSSLAYLGSKWPHPQERCASQRPLIVSPSFLSFSLCFLSWSLCPLQSCWMTSTLWSGCCALFPLTAQGAGQFPWMPRWRITCTSAPTTCASSGTGCAQARMTPSASTVPLPQAGCCHSPGWDSLLCLLHFQLESLSSP